MTAAEQDVHQEVQTIFREVFDDPGLVLFPGMTAVDVADWDSLAHVSLMFTIESHFGISFTDAEMGGLQDVDELIGAVRAHLD